MMDFVQIIWRCCPLRISVFLRYLVRGHEVLLSQLDMEKTKNRSLHFV